MLILNRDFQHPADGWYHIEPKGEHPNAAGGVVQVIDDQACESIVNTFNAAAEKPDFAGMLVDHEHFRHDAEKETRAYGWLMKLENRADGVYGQIRWTGTGKAAVDQGDYRFFSTEYAGADMAEVRNAEPRRARPLRLAGLTLTNQPNNRGGRPITNRASHAPAGPEAGAPQTVSTAALAGDVRPNTNNKMKDLAKMLGLPEDAAEPALMAAVTEIKNRAQTAEAELLQNREAQADADLEPLKDKLPKEQHAAIRAQLVANRAATLPLLKLATASAQPAPAANSILNRATARTPEADSGEKTFVQVFNRHVAAGKTKAEALRMAITTDPEGHRQWLKEGAGKL